LTNEIDSILVDPNSISSYKNAILKLLNNGNLYKSISSNAINKANTQSWQIRAKKIINK
jgi:glycosyltransferase involved in cell wall biosynthesis